MTTQRYSLCEHCDWKDEVYDEIGVIDYCPIKNIYSDKMEITYECDGFRRGIFINNVTT